MPAGNYYSPIPLDFLVLAKLPDKGILGGVHWAGRPVRHVLDEINGQVDAQVTSGFLQGRLRSMKVAGYVEDFAATGGRIWARTAQGAAYLAQREEVLGA